MTDNKYFLPWRAASTSAGEQAYIVSSWSSPSTESEPQLDQLEIRFGNQVYSTQNLDLESQVPLGMELKDFKEAVESALKGLSCHDLDIFIQLEKKDNHCEVMFLLSRVARRGRHLF